MEMALGWGNGNEGRGDTVGIHMLPVIAVAQLRNKPMSYGKRWQRGWQTPPFQLTKDCYLPLSADRRQAHYCRHPIRQTCQR